MSKFNQESEEPLQGAKMIVMDILELRDINGPAPKNQIWTNPPTLFRIKPFWKTFFFNNPNVGSSLGPLWCVLLSWHSVVSCSTRPRPWLGASLSGILPLAYCGVSCGQSLFLSTPTQAGQWSSTSVLLGRSRA